MQKRVNVKQLQLSSRGICTSEQRQPQGSWTWERSDRFWRVLTFSMECFNRLKFEINLRQPLSDIYSQIQCFWLNNLQGPPTKIWERFGRTRSEHISAPRSESKIKSSIQISELYFRHYILLSSFHTSPVPKWGKVPKRNYFLFLRVIWDSSSPSHLQSDVSSMFQVASSVFVWFFGTTSFFVFEATMSTISCLPKDQILISLIPFESFYISHKISSFFQNPSLRSPSFLRGAEKSPQKWREKSANIFALSRYFSWFLRLWRFWLWFTSNSMDIHSVQRLKLTRLKKARKAC
jgi:hypothetical protein